MRTSTGLRAALALAVASAVFAQPTPTDTATNSPFAPSSQPAAELVQLKVDLIVIATHGYTGLKHVLLGSTTERVVRHARCPVLVVRNR